MVRRIHRIPVALILSIVLGGGSAVCGQTLIDNFDDGNDSGWRRYRGPMGLFDASTGEYRLTTSGTVPVGAVGYVGSIWRGSLADSSAFSDGFLRARVRANTMGTSVSLTMRASGDLLDGYSFVGNTDEGSFRVFECVRGRCGNIQYTDVPFDTDQDWFLEAGAVEDEITLKAWQVGEEEPVDAQLRFRDSSFRDGAISVGAYIASKFDRRAKVDAVFDDIAFHLPSEPMHELQPGDADQDLSFDQFDLVQVQQAAKYRTGQAATWGEGDWNGAPGGFPGSPPEGDGVFDQFDIIAAQQAAVYRTGSYAGLSATDAAVVAIPEPSTIVLAALGFVGILSAVRRRWRSVWSIR